jgi:peptide/nickel transport system substrate-binding protein
MNSEDPKRHATSELVGRRRVLSGAAGLALSAPLLGRATSARAAETPKKGGNLRVAILGGGSSDTLDANSNVTQPDTARVVCLYQPLATFRQKGVIENLLAESLESNKTATEWTIRLRRDVAFHDGKPLTAADVAFTLRRVTDPKAPLPGAPELGPMDRDSLKVMDDHTLRVSMHSPFAIFNEAVADDINLGIVPVGYDPKKPVGTGAFKYESFLPGQQSVFSRFDGYWGPAPHLDTVTIIDSFESDTAAFNALQGGEIDVFAAATLSLARQVRPNGPIKLNVSAAGQWTPFTMRVDTPPFDNPDVRMAFRLLVDREQIIRIAFSGFGVPCNDVFSLWDGAPEAFHRKRDVAQARALLKKAGHENLTVELVTSDVANGVVASAQIFARQAQDAGVTVKVRQVTSDVLFGKQYLQWPFAQDFASPKPYLPQVSLFMLPQSPFNETHWRDPSYLKLFNAALAELDLTKRNEICREMETIEFERGGYIIPSFNQLVDLAASNVNGLHPGTIFAMGDYDFGNIWLS